MSGPGFYFFALFLACLLLCQLLPHTLWSPGVTRAERPRQYWLLLGAQGAILLPFLLTDRSWHVR